MQLFQIPPTALFGLRHQEATMQRSPEQGLPVLYLRQSGNLKIKTKNAAIFWNGVIELPGKMTTLSWTVIADFPTLKGVVNTVLFVYISSKLLLQFL